MIRAENISLSIINGRKITNNLSFVLNDNDKLAIIGEEGNGKSTFLKFIYDSRMIEDYSEYSGRVNIIKSDIGYLPQSMDERWYDYGAFDYILKSAPEANPEYSVYNDLFIIEKLFNEYRLDKEILKTNRNLLFLSGGEKVN